MRLFFLCITGTSPTAILSDFTPPSPTMPPDLKHRQADVLRTLTITRDTTTFTTVVTLGNGPGETETSSPEPNPTTPTSQSAPVATTTPARATGTTSLTPTPTPTTFFSVASSSTASLVAPSTQTSQAAAHHSSGVPSSVIVGAVLGSVFGSVGVLLLIWFCCYSPYRPRWDGLLAFNDDVTTEESVFERKSRRSTRGSRVMEERYSFRR